MNRSWFAFGSGAAAAALLMLVGATSAMAQGPPPVCLDSLEPLLHDTSSGPNACLGLETNNKFFEISRFQWRGRPEIAVNTGNDLQIWDISDPQSPNDVDDSGFGVNNQGDSDYDLVNHSICDDCQWGVATYKLGHVLFGLGTDPVEPDFQLHRFYETGTDDPRGAFTFKIGSQQFLLAKYLPGDCGGDATIYRFNGTNPSDFTAIGCVDVPGYDGKLLNGFHIEKDGDHWLYLGFENRRIYIYEAVPQGNGVNLQYTGNDDMLAYLARGKGMAVDRTRELAVTTMANNGLRIWDISSPSSPVELSYIPGDFNLAAITYPFVWVGRSLVPDTSKTYNIKNPSNPEAVDPNFWHPDQYWNSHNEECEWPQGAAFSPDGMTMYIARYSVVQMVDFTLCAGPLQPTARIDLPAVDPFPGENATVADASLPTVERRAIWVTNSADPAGPVICGDDPPQLRVDHPLSIDCWIRKDLAADMERWAHVAADNPDFPCGAGNDPLECPGIQIASREIAIDRSPEAFISVQPVNPITGDTVDLFGSYEGNPAANPFQWKAWWGAVPVGTGGDQDWSLELAESGDYLIRYSVDYEHEDPSTGLPYQEKAYASITVTSVAAALDLPVNPVNTEPIMLDGSNSNHTAGVNLSWLWQVTGSTIYNGCPDSETCTIAAESLNPGLHTVTLTLTNTDNGDQSTAQATMDVLDGHVDIQVTPPAPDIGEVVTFDILGYPNDVVAVWDFGGPGCDPFSQQETCVPTYTSCLSMAFKYSTPGLKSVSVELTDPTTGDFVGSASFELTVQDHGTCDGCTFAVNPVEDLFSAEGGAGTFAVETQTDCVWVATAPEPWITITDPGGGSGADTVSYLVDENANPARFGAIQVRDLQHTVLQSGVGNSDVASSMTGTAEPPAGQTTTLWVTYGNDGPDDTLDTLINVEIPFGLPAEWAELTAEDLDDLQNSAAVLDAFGYPVSTTDDPLGNWPLLRLDDESCDRLRFQVQGPDWVGEPEPTPVSGLVAGASSTWTFELPIPSDGVKTGQMEIISGPSAGSSFSPATTAITHTDAHGARRFGSGLNCRDLVDGCSRLMDCFGPRLWQLDPPLVADLQVASDDGYGCEALQGFVVGRAALVKVGGCSYFEKADNAQAAGASAVIVINDGQCPDGTTSDSCVMDMDGGPNAGDIDVPVLMLSVADGQPMMDEVSGGGTVRIRFGNIPSGRFSIDSMAYHSLTESDPMRDDDGETFVLQGLPAGPVFDDGFDLGDLESWSRAAP